MDRGERPERRLHLRRIRRSYANCVEATLGLIVDIGGQRSLQQAYQVFVQMLKPRRSDNGGVYLGMRKGESQDERRAALALLSELVEACVVKLLPFMAVAQAPTWLALRRSTANDGADSGLCGFCDVVFVLPLEGEYGIMN